MPRILGPETRSLSDIGFANRGAVIMNGGLPGPRNTGLRDYFAARRVRLRKFASQGRDR